MTVQNPSFPDCPSCNSQTLIAVEKVAITLTTDGEGGVKSFDDEEYLQSYTSLWCDECGKVMIEDGEWVMDPTSGEPVRTDGSGFRTFDQFEK